MHICLTLARILKIQTLSISFWLLSKNARNSQAKCWVEKSWVTLVDKGELDGEGCTTLLVRLSRTHGFITTKVWCCKCYSPLFFFVC